MSTAIMQSGAYYDLGDFHLKNQNNSRSMVHLPQQQQPQAIGANNVTQSVMGTSTVTTTTTSPTLTGHINQQNNVNGNNNAISSLPATIQQGSNGVSAAAAAQMLQNQINAAAVAVMQQQQQHHNQQQKMLHNGLTRTISHQPSSSEITQTLLNQLMENMNAVGHRKLERTQSEPAPQVNTSRYKTELCRPFEEAGVCKYAEKCQFAHGAHELRNLQRHPKYKTEYCRTFHSVGFCPYGPRCHFVHNEEDAPLLPSRATATTGFSGRGNVTNAIGATTNAVNGGATHSLPMSPPLSMSTGSDRASPTGSLSPTNSMASFPFPDQSSPTFSTSGVPQSFQMPPPLAAATNPIAVIYSSSSLHISPPASPPTLSTTITPPPTPNVVLSVVTMPSSKVVNTGNAAEETRLPIFNQISCSSLDALFTKNLAM